jgi:peptide/nickel transport system substrate-binding protein
MRRVMFRAFRGIISSIVFLGIAGCGIDENSHTAGGGRGESALPVPASVAPNPVAGGRLIVGVQQEPERLSDILSATATNNLVCNLVFSRFVKYDDQLHLIPDLIEFIPTVENGGVSRDHLAYTYTLRRGVRWHDGEPLTSRDVAFTYRMIIDPAVNVESREGWNVIDSVETPDDYTVIFRLERPYPDFVRETFYDESVLPEHILSADRGTEFNISEFHRAPVGSGPFVFKQWVQGSHLELSRSDVYYGEGPYLDAIVFKFIPDENTMIVQLKTGEIDLYDNADVNFIAQISRLPGLKIYRTSTLMYEHLDLNMEHPILSDKRVRQALSYATNKAEIAEKVYKGMVTVAPLDEIQSSRYYNVEAAAKALYSPLRARRLLRDAGWIDEDGDGIVEKNGQDLVLTITTTSGRLNRERTELVLKDQYRRVGIDLRIENYNPTVLYGSYEDGGILKRGKFDIALYAWLSSPDPATKMSLYASSNIPPNGQNNPRIRHATLTRLLEQGAGEIDINRRVSLYHAAAEILVTEVPVIPLFWYTAIDGCTERLQNFRPNPTQSADTWNAHTWFLRPGV